jgi:hypothetical protein
MTSVLRHIDLLRMYSEFNPLNRWFVRTTTESLVCPPVHHRLSRLGWSSEQYWRTRWPHCRRSHTSPARSHRSLRRSRCRALYYYTLYYHTLFYYILYYYTLYVL